MLALFGERHHGCLGPNMERTNRICKQIYWFAYIEIDIATRTAYFSLPDFDLSFMWQ